MDEQRRKEYWATLALKYCTGLGARSQRKLLAFYGTAYRAVEECRNWRSAGIKDEIINEMKREKWRKAAHKEWKITCQSNLSFMLWSDEIYPASLRVLPDAPILLYFSGDISLLQSPGIAIVGSRNASPHGREVAYYMAKSLASSGIAVISGMANGIDKSAHEAALRQIGKSIGVLGTGIKVAYPRGNLELFGQMRETGLLLSEFAPETPPLSNNFPIRNRIISGLGLACVVIEARKNSGSLITARYALEQNREVFAVPGAALDLNSTGCQELVRQGAKPVFTADDIIEELVEVLKQYKLTISTTDTVATPSNGMVASQSDMVNTAACSSTRETKNKVRYEDVETEKAAEKIFELLTGHDNLTIDSISDILEMDIGRLNSIILDMELYGQIIRVPGAKIKLND